MRYEVRSSGYGLPEVRLHRRAVQPLLHPRCGRPWHARRPWCSRCSRRTRNAAHAEGSRSVGDQTDTTRAEASGRQATGRMLPLSRLRDPYDPNPCPAKLEIRTPLTKTEAWESRGRNSRSPPWRILPICRGQIVVFNHIWQVLTVCQAFQTFRP